MSSENYGGQSSRRIPKQKWISMENDELHNYIEDLEKSLALNKQVLSDLILSKIPGEGGDTGNIITQLIQEVKEIDEYYMKIVRECENNQAKALMDEQIATEYHRKEQEFISDSEEKITDIIYQNDKRSKIISELSIRIRQLEEDSELYKKSRNLIVVPPTLDIIDLHCRVEELKTILSYEARNLYSLQSKQDKLKLNAEALSKEVEKTRVLLKNPMNRKCGMERVSNKNDQSLEIIKQEDSDESLELPQFGFTVAPVKSKSQPLFELSLNRQNTLSIDLLTLSYKENDSEAKHFIDINDHIDALKTEIQKITEDLMRISRENEILLETNEKLARTYAKTHDFINSSDLTERKIITKSKCSRSNSNINDELFKFIDSNLLSPRNN